jgi:hypothetical protein
VRSVLARASCGMLFDLNVLCLIALPLQNHTLPSRDGCKTSAAITNVRKPAVVDDASQRLVR